MAQFFNLSIVLIALISFFATPSNAHILGPILSGGEDIALVIIRGLLTCSMPSPLPMARPLPGVNVSLSCDNGRTSLAQALTDLTGGISMAINPIIDEVLFHSESDCSVIVKLSPGLNCSAFPPTGILSSPLRTIAIVGSVIGPVLSLVAPSFTLLNIV